MLDVRDDASLRALAQALGERHAGVDIVLSNAARIFPQVPTERQVRTFVDANNRGTLAFVGTQNRYDDVIGDFRV
jgi:NAD(P)-dependent dehydrogenase (short-subunit alcohol dehydrogenase family)